MTQRIFKSAEIDLLDGRRVSVALSWGAVKRIAARLGTDEIKDATLQFQVKDAGVIFYESLTREVRASMPLEEFEELLPGNPEAITAALARMVGISMPESDPNASAPEASPQLSTGQASGDSAASVSV